ncbi:MAG: hypothetical protein GTN86_02270 [Xanthomonadales bacterium]|nr:hypothetical protein [Xanthomonadales bacterium]NIN58839.1 hypothetical protein [Xanthomonadales bacterium]NIN74107.1 hypothetical protein [Xanthomonadales bacterium]NIO14640.1 hypothetical protein [Xanthomonadales bacterium]NIP11232.1 hypothetical protein [Xanthomonadales bacterium]
MRTLARFSLLLVLILVVVSAYLRLHQSGLGCADWPACYGQIGALPAPATGGAAEEAYRRILAASDAPLAWAAPLHRLVATLLGLAVVVLNLLAFRARQHRLLSISLLGLTLLLAALGLRSGNLHDPAVVMGNLAGGFAMVGLLGWLAFELGPRRPRYTDTHVRAIRPLVRLGLALLCLQILLGGLTSVNFAATACPSLPHCEGQWFPDATLYGALRLDRARAVDATGHAIGGHERQAVHQAHRVGALLAAAALLAAVIAGLRGVTATRRVAVVILAVLVVEFAIGVVAVVTRLPIAVAVAHNALAAVLLLATIRLWVLTRRPRMP